MAIKVKKGGVYADPVGIFAKKAGVYSAVAGVSAKVAGAYVSTGVGARAWLPTDLGANLLSWHKKDTATVSAWPDSAGNGLNFVQATPGNQPTLDPMGGVALTSAHYMGCPSMDAGTGVYTEGTVSCWTVADTTSDKSILRGVSGGTRDISAERSARFWFTKIAVSSVVGTDPYLVGKNISTSLAQPIYTGISVGVNGAALSVRAPQATPTADSTGVETRLGGRGNISVHELVRFHSQNTTPEDRQRVEGYVAWNNGAQDSLAPAHPYKNARPTYTNAAPSAFARLSGINGAGGEFTHDAAGLPGTMGTQYVYPSAPLLAYLRTRGHRLIRLPFRWERIQQTLGGALNATGIAELKAAVQRCADVGLLVLLDMHNYGRYIRLDDVEVIFGIDGTLSQAHFTDVWAKLVNEFAGQPAIAGWGIMNEPHDFTDIPAVPGTFTGTQLASFDATVEGWTANNGGTVSVGTFTGMTGAGAFRASILLAANSGNYNSSFSTGSPPGGSIANASFPPGTSIEYEVYIPASTPGTWRVRPSIVNTSFGAVSGSYANITKGQVNKVYMEVPPALDGNKHLHINFQWEVDGSDGATPSVVYIGNVAVGTISGASPAQRVWPFYSQAVVSAIRATGDTRHVYVGGYAFSGAQSWASQNPATAWITDPANKVIYEAHYYFDPNNSGSFAGNYDSTVNDAIANKGYASLQARVTAELKPFTDWLAANNAKGFVGEIGWPKGVDAASWNVIGGHAYDLLDAAGVGVAYWATGDFWGDSYSLEPYKVSNLTTYAQAAVIEAHPSQLL